MTDTMTAQTKAEALEASILHWQENVKAETPDDVRMSDKDCALCAIFYKLECSGCPVAEAVGHISCRKTPYLAAYNAYEAWKHTNPSSCANTWLAARDEFHRRAQAEVDFLISLRETE